MDKLTVIDMHTGGEPLRIVTGGYPPIPKGAILEKRAYVRDHLDHYRKILVFEPRGHYDMYGALLVEPSLPGADLAVLFMHNEGYSTMCGHAVIALGRYAIDYGLVAPQEPVTTVNIECPCGMVVASVEVTDGKTGVVSFESVPAFLAARDRRIQLPGLDDIVFDVAYGGAFYAIADCRQFGLEFGRNRARDFVDAATALTEKVKAEVPLSHPVTKASRKSRPGTFACSPMPKLIARRPARALRRGLPPCMRRGRSALARRGFSRASLARNFPAM